MIDTYEQIRIINLASRVDRRLEMLGELERMGLDRDPRVKFVDAIVPDNPRSWSSRGARGCFMSHLSILKSAQEAGKSVLILEDDCDFTDAAVASKWGVGSDIFYGGFGATDYSDLQRSAVQGSHCMGFNRKTVPLVVKFLEDLATQSAPPPIDGAYVDFRRSHPTLQTEFALPQVAVQRQSSSDISPGRFDRNPISRFAVGLVRKLNRGRYRRRKMTDGL